MTDYPEFPKPSLETVYERYDLRIFGADRGGWRRAQCPNPDHEDKNPSASVNESECKWWCHACGLGGDAVDLIEMREPDAGRAGARRIAESLLDGSSEQVRHDGGPGSGLSVRARRNKGYRNVPQSAPWMRL